MQATSLRPQQTSAFSGRQKNEISIELLSREAPQKDEWVFEQW